MRHHKIKPKEIGHYIFKKAIAGNHWSALTFQGHKHRRVILNSCFLQPFKTGDTRNWTCALELSCSLFLLSPFNKKERCGHHSYLTNGRSVLFHTEMPGNCHSYIQGMQNRTIIQWGALSDTARQAVAQELTAAISIEHKIEGSRDGKTKGNLFLSN